MNCEIENHICNLREADEKRWSKEVNMVSWYGKEAVIDIREWSPDHSRCGKGITLTDGEAAVLGLALTEYITENGK